MPFATRTNPRLQLGTFASPGIGLILTYPSASDPLTFPRHAFSRLARFDYSLRHLRLTQRSLTHNSTDQCYAGADEPQECVLQKEDYLECLHRTKEVRLASGASDMLFRAS